MYQAGEGVCWVCLQQFIFSRLHPQWLWFCSCRILGDDYWSGLYSLGCSHRNPRIYFSTLKDILTFSNCRDNAQTPASLAAVFSWRTEPNSHVHALGSETHWFWRVLSQISGHDGYSQCFAKAPGALAYRWRFPRTRAGYFTGLKNWI